MIWTWSISCDSSPAGKRSVQKSYTRPKKEALRFLYQCFPGGPLANQLPDRFSWRKNLSNTGETGLLTKRRNNREIDALVTTRHLFSASRRGAAGNLLPTWQPNSDFLNGKCNGFDEGGGGGRPAAIRRNLRIDKLAQKFYSKGRPPLPFCVKKNRAPRARRNTEPAQPALSYELVAERR